MKTRSVCALLLALMLLALAGCGKKEDHPQPEDPNVTQEEGAVPVHLVCSNGSITLRFSLEEGHWLWADDKTFPLDESYALALLESVGIDEETAGRRVLSLSGGEQQRIAIARVMLKNAPIVILDEATAFADPENEVLIQKAFAVLTKGRTVIMIAHRLSTVVGADQILVLDKGRIVEQGSHSVLSTAGGLYARMWADYNQAVQWKITSEREVE